ncbi:MAG: multidrug efflux RND transporter permease subunit [Rhodospirillales bacterium]|nr:multidrug efflux RND transporter permease subunit [Rhodospirillales bacterium]
MFSKFFINRPIFATVIAVLTVLAGVVTVLTLPISQYPNITPPVVQVTTTYPGASARTVVDTVALPIEQQVNGVENMLYMQSTSASDGTYKLQVTFAVGTDLDFAQVLVQNRVASAMAQLPPQVAQQGVVTKKVSTAILQVVSLISPNATFDSLYLSNYATINMVDVLKRLNGVGDVNVFGAGQYSMRIWLNPDQLKTRNITTTDVVNAVQGQNNQVASGQLGAPPAPNDQDFQLTLNVQGRLDEAREFENIIVKIEPGEGGRITRVKDVARVELGAQTYSQLSRFDGRPSAGVAIYQLPGANALDVADEVRGAVSELSQNFPEDLAYNIAFDTTVFTRDSIAEVYKTLFEAAILVFLVIFLFLQEWRATLIPAITIPVSLVGTFSLMALFGISINTVSLFGLVLAIGIVVDDAIVVVENVWHNMETHGLGAHDAAIRAMEEISAPIVAITLVLMAVFVPAALMPGITGQLYRQFAITIAASTFFSAVNALTLSPALCALLLKPPQERRFFIFRWFNAAFAKLAHGQHALVSRMIGRKALVMVLFVAISAVAVWGFRTLPGGFLPEEDQGYAVVGVQLPDGQSLQRTQQVVEQVDDILAHTPGVAHRVAIGGISLLDNSATLANAAVFYVIFSSFHDRNEAGLSQNVILNKLRQDFAGIQDALIFAVVPPAIQGLGVSGGFQMQLLLKGGSGDYAKLQEVAQELIRNGNSQSGLTGLSTSFRATVPQLFADVNRVKAETLDVPVGDVFQTIQSYLGSTFVNQFNKFGRTFQVYVQAESAYRLEPDDLSELYVRNRSGQMVPLGTMTDIDYTTGPALLSLFNLYPTATINGRAAPGYSSGQALTIMEQMAQRSLPPDMGFAWSGMSYQEKQVGGQSTVIFGLSLLVVFLLLAAQYESWTNPLAVILIIPLSLLGVVIAVAARSFDNNIYTQIGIVLLIALASKNAILIVEVARELRAAGTEIGEAAMEASRVRFRPILMTSFAFILGVVPLVIASGAGAASRQALGTAVFGGMIAATVFNGTFTPVFYAAFQGLSEWLARRRRTGTPGAEAGGRETASAGAAGER